MAKYETEIQPVNTSYAYPNMDERKAFNRQEGEVARTLLGKDATSLRDVPGSIFIINKDNKTFRNMPENDVLSEVIMGNAKSYRLYVRDKNNALRQVRLEKDENDEIFLAVSQPVRVLIPKRPDYYYLKKFLSIFVKSFKEELDQYQTDLEAATKPYKNLEKYHINLNPNDAPLQPEPLEEAESAKQEPEAVQDEQDELQADEVVGEIHVDVKEPEVKKPEEESKEKESKAKTEEKPAAKLVFVDEGENKGEKENAPKQKPAAKAAPSKAAWMHFQSQSEEKNKPLLPSQMNPQQFYAHLEEMDKHNKESLITIAMANKKCTPDLYYEAVEKTLEAQVAGQMLTKAKGINDPAERNAFLEQEKYTYTSLSAGLRSFVRQKIDPDLVTRFCRNPGGFTDEADALLEITDNLQEGGVQEYLEGIQAQNAAMKGQMQANQPQAQQLQQSQPQIQQPQAPSMGGGAMG